MVIPELPDDVWKCIICRGGVHTNIIGINRCTRDVALALIMSIHKLNYRQALAFAKVVYLRQNVFITGGGGTGKSHLAQAITDRVCRPKHKRCAVGIVAPTGAAARVASTALVMGSTLHRYFNIRRVKRRPGSANAMEPSQQPTKYDTLALLGASADAEVEAQLGDGLETAVVDENVRDKLCALRLLWIDEVSMIDKSMLELCDAALRLARRNDRPWGGLQVLITGDFFQFSPVGDGSGVVQWAFHSRLWQTLHEVELTELVRQSNDPTFAHVLGRMRVGRMLPGDVAWINAHSRKTSEPPLATLLPTNKACATANVEGLSTMHGEEIVYEPEQLLEEVLETTPIVSTRIYKPNTRDRVVYPRSGAALALKLGCPVRSTKNSYVGHVLKIANGQRGRVIGIRTNEVEVSWQGIGHHAPRTTIVKRARTLRLQSFITERGNHVIASQAQFPLRLAFAQTLHSAQGATLPGPIVVDARFREPDPNDAEQKRWRAAAAAVYVTLSRAQRIQDVKLLAVLKASDVRVCPVVRAHFGIP